jgi:hypothetical protein
LGAFVVLEKPADPEEFLINKLKEIQEAKKRKQAVSPIIRDNDRWDYCLADSHPGPVA